MIVAWQLHASIGCRPIEGAACCPDWKAANHLRLDLAEEQMRAVCIRAAGAITGYWNGSEPRVDFAALWTLAASACLAHRIEIINGAVDLTRQLLPSAATVNAIVQAGLRTPNRRFTASVIRAHVGARPNRQWVLNALQAPMHACLVAGCRTTAERGGSAVIGRG